MSKWSNTRAGNGQSKKIRNLSSLMMASVLTPLLSVPAFAQGEVAEEEIVVTGTRQVIQDQIAIKRNAVGVVDGLSSSEIGELPALSIGEALESITGVASHRENGGATEVTIRGLGPFLSMTTFNGREATNGSGDRSVNFSQFPSELMNKIAVVKTQSADMIEGGVAGVIALETLQPLDYGKRRFQIDGKLNWNPDDDNIENNLSDDIGTRLGASYVDQFEFDNGMALGWSFGGQRSRISQPEAEVRSTSPTGSSLFACLNELSETSSGFFRTNEADCEDGGSSGNNGFDNEVDENGVALDDGKDFAWTGSTRGFRQNETADERDAIFAAFQFQPNEQWDINLDMQFSEREQREERHDLNFETKRVRIEDGISVTGAYVNDALVIADDGTLSYNLDGDGNIIQGANAPQNNVLQQWTGEPDILLMGEKYSRLEKYNGGGLAITYTPTDALTLDLDVSRSRTTRVEHQIGNQTQSRDRQNVTFFRGENGIHQFLVEDFDVTDPASFYDSDRFRTRVDTENDRENIVEAVRFDLAYDIDAQFIKTIKAGVRSSTLTFVQMGGNGNGGNGSRTTIDLDQGDVAGVVDEGTLTGQQMLENCVIDFPESGFLSGVTSGALITNVDNVLDPTTVNENGTGNSYVAYDNQCFSDAIHFSDGQTFAYPETIYENVGTIDVEEDTIAAYLLADYEFDFGLRGNVGVRVVQTDVTSTGFRSSLEVERNTAGAVTGVNNTGDIERISGGSDYTEVLPSAQFVYDLNDDMILRGGIFRGMSRVDPGNMGFQRTFSFSEEADGADSVGDLVAGVTANGNPSSEPFLSWNTDISWEWYPDDDTVLSVGLYHKTFNGGFEQVVTNETFVVGGEEFTVPVTNQGTSDDTSDLYGIEITGSYRWDIGVGVKVSYNHAETNFEFQDNNYGETFDADGNLLTTALVEPASIPGFSEDVFSGQIYYQYGEFDIAAIYKYRSEYFQPYTSNGNRLRYVGDVGVWEARASYKLNDNIKFKVEAINLFSEERTDYFYTNDNFGQLSDYGPRVFVGVTAKF